MTPLVRKITKLTVVLYSRTLRKVHNVFVKILPRNVKDFLKKFIILDNMLLLSIYGESLNPKEKVNYLLFLLQNQIYKKIEGDVMECGVYRGGTIIQMGLKLKELNSNKVVHGIDTFEGHPYCSKEDMTRDGVLHYKGRYSRNNYEKVKKIVKKRGADNVILYKGKCEDVFPSLNDKKFCFVHVDMDIYISTKHAIEFLKDKMVENGIILFDDYNIEGTIGVTTAIHEMLGKENIIQTGDKGCYWIKKSPLQENFPTKFEQKQYEILLNEVIDYLKKLKEPIVYEEIRKHAQSTKDKMGLIKERKNVDLGQGRIEDIH